MADPLDPNRAEIAMRLAVTRWRKGPDDSIETKLDDPQEWLMESALMNHFLPHDVGPRFSFVAVQPNEFSVGIKLVRQYAGLIYKHMVPVAAAVAADVDAHFRLNELADTGGGADTTRAASLLFAPFGGR